LTSALTEALAGNTRVIESLSSDKERLRHMGGLLCGLKAFSAARQLGASDPELLVEIAEIELAHQQREGAIATLMLLAPGAATDPWKLRFEEGIILRDHREPIDWTRPLLALNDLRLAVDLAANPKS
jgi:hypothetical protein